MSVSEITELKQRIAEVTEELRRLKERLHEDDVRPVRGSGGGGGAGKRYAVVRDVPSDDEPYVEITYAEKKDASPWWVLPVNTVETVRTEGITKGKHYRGFIWGGSADDFPDAPLGDVNAPMHLFPVETIEGEITILWRPMLWPPPLTGDAAHTDAFHVAGGGANVELVFG